MKTALISLFVMASGFLYAVEANSVNVLCYHAFSHKDNPYTFSIEELDSQLRLLYDKGYNFISMSDLRSGRVYGKKNILVTVDDGNKSVYEAYHRVFKKYNIKPVIGIYPAIIERKEYALTWKQVTELHASGCEIAAHGYNHLYVNKKLHDTDPKAFRREIFTSKEILEKKLNTTIDTYIYPFGVKSDITVETLKKAGFKYAFTINTGEILMPSVLDKKSFELPRYMITRPAWKISFNMIAKKAGEGKSGFKYHKASADQAKPVMVSKAEYVGEPAQPSIFAAKPERGITVRENVPGAADSQIAAHFINKISSIGISYSAGMEPLPQAENNALLAGFFSFMDETDKDGKPIVSPDDKDKKKPVALPGGKARSYVSGKNADLQSDVKSAYTNILVYVKSKVHGTGDRIYKLFKGNK